MKKVTLKIGGMSCSACSNGLEKCLNRQDGVIGASVNLVMNNATIEYDETRLTIDDLNKFVAMAGFESLGIDDYKKDAKKEKRKKIELIILAVLSVIIMYISMGHMIHLYIPSFIDMNKNPQNFALTLAILTIPALFLGKDILLSGFKNAIHLMPNMDTLVSIGVISSLLYSIFSTVMIFLGKDHYAHQIYFESCTIIIFFIKIGRYIDGLSKSKTTEAIQDLMRLTPSYATIIKNNKLCKVTIDEIQKGDIVVCKSGESIAVDGKIIKGETTINEALITGESSPSNKKVGDMVIAGSINGDGYIEYEAIRIGKESTVSEIVRMVVEATNTKAPIARVADTVSKYFVQGVLIISILGFLLWLIISKDFAIALNVFVSVLVIACPCALGLATPIAMVVSNGKSAKMGILVKNNTILETFHKIQTIVFDKTGTLTEGNLKLQKELYLNNDLNILQIVGSVEKKSSHPIAIAITKKCEKQNIEYLDVNGFENIPGMGIKATVNNQMVLIGNERLMNNYNIDIDNYQEQIEDVINDGNTLLLVAIDEKLVAIYGAKDAIKESSYQAIQKLKEKNIEVVMLTGDNDKTAQAVAKEINIDRVISNVLPSEKARIIKELKDEGKVIAMVGDGINDAPSLALADIGISISSATDIAVNSASVVLMQDDLNKINDLFNISKKTIKIVKENLFWAFFYNACMIPIALGALSFASITMNPMIGSFAMMFSSLSVILNALRLR